MMRTTMITCAALVFLLVAAPVSAELQTVQVGGEIRILGEYYRNVDASPGGEAIRWPALAGANWLSARPIGTFDGLGNGNGILSAFRWNDDGNDTGLITQWTKLNFQADFTNEVRAFIELDSVDVWGEDFRSDYLTGADGRAVSSDDIEVYQAYIEANEMFGLPLRARIGRQEICLGSQWLVGNNDSGPAPTWGLSFDAIRLTYATDVFSIDAFAALLAEGGIAEEDEDIWLYGIYGSYLGLEDITIDAYWLWVRDARSLNDTNFVWFVEWLEDIFDIDDYNVTNIHTIGLRGTGAIGAFDFEAEIAYQWGDAGQVGSLFTPFLYGDDGAEYSEWGMNLELGYSFDVIWQPRVYLGYAYLGGEDNRDINWWEWWWPFDRPEASVSFNRLFSNTCYSDILCGTDLSNVHVFRGGVSAAPTESIELELAIKYLQADETFASPVYWNLGPFLIPIAPALSFWTTENDDDLGWEVGLCGTYHYSEDLSITLGWTHLFVGDGLAEGNFNQSNGLGFNGGNSDDDAEYLYFETTLVF